MAVYGQSTLHQSKNGIVNILLLFSIMVNYITWSVFIVVLALMITEPISQYNCLYLINTIYGGIPELGSENNDKTSSKWNECLNLSTEENHSGIPILKEKKKIVAHLDICTFTINHHMEKNDPIKIPNGKGPSVLGLKWMNGFQILMMQREKNLFLENGRNTLNRRKGRCMEPKTSNWIYKTWNSVKMK